MYFFTGRRSTQVGYWSANLTSSNSPGGFFLLSIFQNGLLGDQLHTLSRVFLLTFRGLRTFKRHPNCVYASWGCGMWVII